MTIEIILGVIAVIVSLLLIRKAKYYSYGGGFFKLIDDELLFLFLAGFPLSLIIEGFIILSGKVFTEPKIELKTNIWILRIALIVQMLIWSQLIAKLISIF